VHTLHKSKLVGMGPAVGRAFHMVEEMESMMCAQGLKGMYFFSRRSGGVVSFIDYLMGGYREGRARLL